VKTGFRFSLAEAASLPQLLRVAAPCSGWLLLVLTNDATAFLMLASGHLLA
jgi:hypothetical protein